MQPTPPKHKRQGLIAKIHIAKQQLRLDDDSYRAILRRVAGTDSCAKIQTIYQLQDILAEMQRLGFQPARPNVALPKLRRTAQTAMLHKTAALLAADGKSWAYAEGMAKRMFGVEKVEYLDDSQTRKLIAALNIHIRKRQAAKAAATQ